MELLKSSLLNDMILNKNKTCLLTSISSAAISINNLSTFSASLADVSKKYMPCLYAKSSPTCVGISLSSRSILFPDIQEYIIRK